MEVQSRFSSVRSMAPLIAIVVAIAISASSLYFMAEALEERESAAASAELRLASLTLASADALIGTSLESAEVDLDGPKAVLAGDHDAALHSLSSVDRARTERLLDGVGEHGHSGMHSAVEHSELQILLERSTELAQSSAAEAEERAATSAIVAAFALAIAAWTAIRARNRARRDELASDAESALRYRLETLLNDLPDMLFVFDDDRKITYRSASVDELLPADATIDDFMEIVPPGDRKRLALALRAETNKSEVFEVRGSAKPMCLDLRVTDLADDEFVDGHLVTARDVTEELSLRSELELQASMDVLTRLPNRRALDPALATVASVGKTGFVGFLLIDFDNFKEVNDTFGHLVGDRLLRDAAARMKSVLRADEMLLRLGGDEFAVILAPVAGETALIEAGVRFRAALSPAFDFGDTTERLLSCAGAVILSGDFEPDDLLAKADIALYEAKAAGGDRFVLFEPEMEERARAVSSINRALRVVSFDDEFTLVYQPIFEVSSGDITGLEALLRWDSPTIGQVSPGEFIPVAERMGMMPEIGNWVLNAVCRQLVLWEERGLDESITVSFNVSAQQLEEPDFVQTVFSAAEIHNVRPTRLVVEVTESMVVDQGGEIADRLAELRRGGVKISVDDFGSGYSNLGQLLGLPLDNIKIDRELLLHLAAMREFHGGDPSGPCAIMEAIVTIADMVGANVICEGVETNAQRESLCASGVSHLQGYLMGRPVAPADLGLRLERRAVSSLS